MNKAVEKNIQNQILHWLAMQPKTATAVPIYNGAVYDKHRDCYRRTGKYYRRGVSDILGIWRGTPLAIEVKAPNGKATQDQQDFLADYAQHGAITILAFDLKDVVDTLKAIDKKNGIVWRNVWMP